jgi:ornithine carbamoyltransferase
MYPHLDARNTATAADTLVARARALQLAAQAGASQVLLRGKNLGLLCETDDGDADLFRRAASELGAHVAWIRPSLTLVSSPTEVQHTARMLGRLYDAVECQGMAPMLVQQVSAGADVPVYDGIASPTHPTAQLAQRLDGDMPEADKRRFILQAVLLTSLLGA